MADPPGLINLVHLTKSSLPLTLARAQHALFCLEIHLHLEHRAVKKKCSYLCVPVWSGAKLASALERREIYGVSPLGLVYLPMVDPGAVKRNLLPRNVNLGEIVQFIQ